MKNKQIVKLTENDLHRIVSESVNQVLNETLNEDSTLTDFSGPDSEFYKAKPATRQQKMNVKNKAQAFLCKCFGQKNGNKLFKEIQFSLMLHIFKFEGMNNYDDDNELFDIIGKVIIELIDGQYRDDMGNNYWE